MSNFAFRASAAALGGSLTRPFHEPLPVQAASVLPSVGGYGSARVEGFRFHDLISFKAAYTVVIGNEYDKVNGNGQTSRERSTLALAVVEGLNVLNMVTADLVVGRLVSEGSAADKAADDELPWLPQGSYFVNLRIAGKDVVPARHAALMDRARTRQAVENNPDTKVDKHKDGRLHCALFDYSGADGFAGNRITIYGFGDIYLGEYIVGPDYRKLNMIRLALGSPAAGDVACASLEGNGSGY
jgi:hypothetical protein